MLDEFRSTSITWDKATRRIYSPITANESDSNGRKLNIQVVNSGQVENLTGATLHLYWETKDKTQHGLDAFTASDISKGEFELFYTTGMLSNIGELNATLVLVDSTGKVVSDWFKITVARGIDNDAIQSENSFSSLTQALIDISNLEQNYAPRLNDLTAQLQKKASKGEVGAPLTASDIAGMTDKEKVYVNTTDGKWYSWNGTDWMAGGTYNSQGLGDGTVTEPKIAPQSITTEKFSKKFIPNGLTTIVGRRLGGWFQSRLVYTISAPDHYIIRFPVYRSGRLTIRKPSNVVGVSIVAGIFTDTGAEYCSHQYTPGQSFPGMADTGTQIAFNFSDFELTWSFMYIAFDTAGKQEQDFLYEKVANISDILPYVKDSGSSVPEPNPTLYTFYDELILPKKYPVVEGDTAYVYYDNPILKGNYYHGTIVSANRVGLGDAYTFTASADQRYSVTLNLIEKDGKEKKGFNLQTWGVPKNAGDGRTKKIMLIGESTTESRSFMNAIKERTDNDVLNVEYVGTRITDPSGVHHEARGGWSSEFYRKKNEDGGVINPFFNPANGEFDFAYYLSQNPTVSIPDYVVIHLGINDAFQGNANFLNNLDFFIQNMRSVSPAIKFIIGVTTATSRFDNMYFFENTIRNKIMANNKALITKYDNREAEGIIIAPLYLNVDMRWDMPYQEVPVNKYNPKTVANGTDQVHPDVPGYKKTADVTFWTLKYAESLATS